MSIARYIARRLALLVLVIFGVSVMTFVVARVIPSDPAALYVGGFARASAVKEARKILKLDRPLVVQYADYVRGIFTGDWGTSLVTKRAVLSDLLQFLPVSLQLILLALPLAILIGLPLGVLSARYKGTGIDHAARSVSIVGISLPAFVIAILLQLVFCRLLHVLPAGGETDLVIGQLHPIRRITGLSLIDALVTGNLIGFWDAVRHIILPVIAIAAYPLGVVMRMTRSTMAETLSQDYVRMARAMGISWRAILGRFALKNAMGPVVTLMGLMFAYALVGTFFVEVIFAYPGMGMFVVGAITSLDYPVVVGATLLIAFVYVVMNLITDLVLAWLDPRVFLC